MATTNHVAFTSCQLNYYEPDCLRQCISVPKTVHCDGNGMEICEERTSICISIE